MYIYKTNNYIILLFFFFLSKSMKFKQLSLKQQTTYRK